MPTNKVFYKYYDVLFARKDYRKEISDIFRIVQKYYNSVPKKILEIGCGTGNHTLELAKQKTSIMAIDTDAEMIRLARLKLLDAGTRNIEFHCGHVQDVKDKIFDFALALFNVITYIQDTKSLKSFFCGVKKCLKPGGMFVFDCWNGIAALSDPPQIKTFDEVSDNKRIMCELVPETDVLKQRTRLTYSIKVFNRDNQQVEEDQFSFYQTLWTLMQINDSIEAGGLKVMECCQWFHPGSPISKKDWKIMYICRKPCT